MHKYFPLSNENFLHLADKYEELVDFIRKNQFFLSNLL